MFLRLCQLQEDIKSGKRPEFQCSIDLTDLSCFKLILPNKCQDFAKQMSFDSKGHFRSLFLTACKWWCSSHRSPAGTRLWEAPAVFTAGVWLIGPNPV